MDAAAPGAVDVPTMDLSTVGRTHDEEQAVLEELSDSHPVGHTDRRWLLAIAGIAAVICFGFVSKSVAPPTATNANPGVHLAAESDAARLAPTDDSRPSPWPAARGIELGLPAGGASVTGGEVPVSLRTAPQTNAHLSVSVGDAIVGWRNVTTGADGAWEGSLRVFAAHVALPATVHVIALLPRGAAEAARAITLNGGAQVVLWEASEVAGIDGRPAVRYRASAPLGYAKVAAWVTDAAGRRIGEAIGASRVEEWQAGSAGGRELGLGTLAGAIPVRGRITGPVELHLSWRDPVTGEPGVLDRVIEAGATRP